jgi:hypothetical protein
LSHGRVLHYRVCSFAAPHPLGQRTTEPYSCRAEKENSENSWHELFLPSRVPEPRMPSDEAVVVVRPAEPTTADRLYSTFSLPPTQPRSIAPSMGRGQDFHFARKGREEILTFCVLQSSLSLITFRYLAHGPRNDPNDPEPPFFSVRPSLTARGLVGGVCGLLRAALCYVLRADEHKCGATIGIPPSRGADEIAIFDVLQASSAYSCCP